MWLDIPNKPGFRGFRYTPHHEGDMTSTPVSILLKKHSRGPLVIDLPNARLGVLRLDIADLTVMSLAGSGVTPQMRADAQARFEAARALYRSDNPWPSLKAMQAITRRYPTLPIGYDAQMVFHKNRGNYAEGAYYCGQLVAVQPTWKAVALWARLLGQAGQLDDSCALLEFLHAAADDSVSPTDGHPLSTAEVQSVVHDLLVTLTRLQQGARMVEVAQAELRRHGPQVHISYQVVVGHLLCGQVEAARSVAAPLLARVGADHPLHPKLQQMRAMLKL